MSFIQQYKDANARKEVAAYECVNVFKDALLEAIQPVFDKFDKVDSVAVWAYTPSWNDGEPCTFCLNIEDAKINECDPYDDDIEEHGISFEDARLIQKSVSETLSIFDEDDWENAFNSYGFKAVFSKDDNGVISLTEKDYDCGY
jgi:hypothetical protein